MCRSQFHVTTTILRLDHGGQQWRIVLDAIRWPKGHWESGQETFGRDKAGGPETQVCSDPTRAEKERVRDNSI